MVLRMVGEEQLRDQLRVLCEHLPFDVWVRDRSDRCVYGNPAACARWPGLVGSRPEDTNIASSILAVWRSNNDRALAGEIVDGEVVYSNGAEPRVIHNIIAPVRCAGQVIGTVGVNIDITAQRRAERTLAERDKLIACAFDTASSAFGVREIDGDDIVHLLDNSVSAAVFGKTPEELVGRRESELGVPQELLRRVIRTMRRAQKQGTAASFEIEYPTPDGTRLFEGKVVPIEPAEGSTLAHFFYLAEDVTKARRQRAELVRTSRLADLGVLAAGVSHEIRNPASTALLSVDFVRDQLAVPGGLDTAQRAEIISALDDARLSLEIIARVASDFGTLARVEGSKPIAVDLDEVVRSTVGLTRPTVSLHANVELDLRSPRAIAADPIRIAQLVMNLLLNAAQAIARGFRTDGRSRGAIVVTTAEQGDFVVLRVEDDGPGISPEIAKDLFEPFVTYGGRPGASGLGLYISREIVTSFGGTISTEPRPGGGTCMIVTLPTWAVGASDWEEPRG